jgi:hypothetical protein
VGNFQTSADFRDLALRVWQIARSCSDAKSVEQLTHLSFDLMDRAASLEELLTPAQQLEVPAGAVTTDRLGEGGDGS